jgi:hypothetical protein
VNSFIFALHCVLLHHRPDLLLLRVRFAAR